MWVPAPAVPSRPSTAVLFSFRVRRSRKSAARSPPRRRADGDSRGRTERPRPDRCPVATQSVTAEAVSHAGWLLPHVVSRIDQGQAPLHQLGNRVAAHSVRLSVWRRNWRPRRSGDVEIRDQVGAAIEVERRCLAEPRFDLGARTGCRLTGGVVADPRYRCDARPVGLRRGGTATSASDRTAAV